MREGTFLGKKVVMNNRNWERSLRRVDTGKAKEAKSKYVISVACPFCKGTGSMGRNCEKCPLKVFASLGQTDFGCVRMFKIVAKKVGVEYTLHLYDDNVAWYTYKPEDRAARRVLNFIHAGLLKMKEV